MQVRKVIIAFAACVLLLGLQLPLLTAQEPDAAAEKGTAGISNDLLALGAPTAARATESAAQTAASGLQARALPTIGDAIVIDAIASGDPSALLAELQALGLTRGAVYGNVVSGLLPVSSVARLSSVSGLAHIGPAALTNNVGLVDNEALEAQRVDPIVNERFGLLGAGQTVGIISDTFDCGVFGGLPGTAAPNRYADDIASGDLPNDVLILDDFPCGIDEGRGMAQLVHDLVPEADLQFHSALGGQANFAQGILDLANAGSNVVVDDIIYFAEPMFADGIIAQAAQTVVDAGIPYFSSAGNGADRSYESAYRNSGETFLGIWELHDFDPGPGVDAFQGITLDPGESFLLSFQWDDAYGSTSVASPGAATDMDVLIFDDQGNWLSFLSGLDFNQGADPIEIVGVVYNGVSPITIEIAFGKFSGPDPTFVKYVDFDGLDIDVEYGLGAPPSYGHANAAGAVSTAAAFWQTTPAFGVNPPQVNAFSSFGGVPIFFDIFGNRLATPELRPKPEITAVDGSNTTFFFSDSAADADTFPNFFGTSAAAPNAAAVAALMLEADPSLTPTQITQLLQDSAIDITQINTVGSFNQLDPLPVGFDNVSGAGLIQANVAVALTLSSPSLFCDGHAATIYVEDGIIYKKRNQSFIEAGLYQGVLQGTSNNDVIVGTNVGDRIVADNAQDIICGFDGDDDIRAGGGDDRVFAGNGDDTVRAGSGQDYVEGGEGSDTLLGERGDDRLYGQAGSDFVNGGDNQDRLFGGEDGDILSGERGDDRLDGGPGDDSCDGGPNNDQATACEVINNIP